MIYYSGPRMMVTPGQPPQQRPPMRPPVSQQQRMPAMSQAPGSIPQQIVNPAQARMQSPMMGNPQNPNLMSQQQQMVSQHNPVSSQYQVSLISEFQKYIFMIFLSWKEIVFRLLIFYWAKIATIFVKSPLLKVKLFWEDHKDLGNNLSLVLTLLSK